MTKLTKLATLLVATALVASFAAGPAMAALTYDNETSTTTSVSDLVGGETVTNLDNETQAKKIQIISDNAASSSLSNPEENMTVRMKVNDPDNDDDGYTFYENSSTFTVVDATNGHYSITLTHADMFAQLPRDANEDVSVEITTIFNEGATDEESSTITVTASNDEDSAVEVVSDADVANNKRVELTNKSSTFGDDVAFATVDSSEPITANTTSVKYVLANDTVEQRYTNAYDAGSFSSGDYIYTMTATVDDRPIMVFDSSAGEARDAGIFSGGFDDTSDTYAVYDQNGGAYSDDATITVKPQGDDTDQAELDIESTGNRKLGFFANVKNFGFDAATNAGFGTTPS